MSQSYNIKVKVHLAFISASILEIDKGEYNQATHSKFNTPCMFRVINHLIDYAGCRLGHFDLLLFGSIDPA